MKSKIITFLLILCTAPAFAEYKTKAKSAFLLDYDSGAEIVSKSADELMPPSSMLKLMTLAVLFDGVKSGQISLDDRFPVGKNADYQDPV